jgi:transposase
MLRVEQKITIKTLHELGTPKKKIAKELGISKNTVKKYIKEIEVSEKNIFKTSVSKTSKVDEYKKLILKWLCLDPKLSNLRIWEKLKEEASFSYGYDSVRRYVRKLRFKENIYPYIPEGIAGEEAQVDFGYIGFLLDPYTNKKRKAWVFCMRLIYSRYDYYKIVFDQKVSTFIECHINAFRYFGGVPRRVKIDNLKSAILEASFYQPVYQNEYLALSQHYKYLIEPCRVYKPKDKAFVENGIKYVKHNFIAGRSFSDINDCNNQLKHWMKEKAKRVHGTTRKIPLNVFLDEEKSKLIKLPIENFDTGKWLKRKLHPDCYINVDKAYYSVPHEFVGKELNIRVGSSFIEIFNNNLSVICIHPKALKEKQRINNESHFPDWFNDIASRNSKDYYLKQAQKYGDVVHNYCSTMFEENSGSGYRMVQGILTLAKKYDKKRIEKACSRASIYNNYSYQCIKNILTKNLVFDLEDLENFQNFKTSNTYKSDLKEYDLFN